MGARSLPRRQQQPRPDAHDQEAYPWDQGGVSGDWGAPRPRSTQWQSEEAAWASATRAEEPELGGPRDHQPGLSSCPFVSNWSRNKKPRLNQEGRTSAHKEDPEFTGAQARANVLTITTAMRQHDPALLY